MKLKPDVKLLNKISDIILLLPIFFAAAIIPVIVRIIYYDPQLAEYSWFSKTTNVMDMFMYHKNQAMMVLDGVLVAIFVILLFRKRLPAPVIFAPLGIYFILVLISSIFSVSPIHTWTGFYEMKESAFAVFGYCLICYYAFAVIRTELQLKLVIYAVLFGIFLVCAIGVSQFVGHDLYMSDFGKDLIYPQKYAGFKDWLGLNFDVGTVYASLYNPNYVGVYTSIAIPFLMVLSFSLQKKRFIPIYVIFAAMILACLAGCGSKTAVITIVPVMVFGVFYFGKCHWKKMIPVYIIYIVIFAILNAYANSSLVQNAINGLTAHYMPSADYKLTDITLNDEDFTLTYDETKLTVRYIYNADDYWTIQVMDNGKEILPVYTASINGYTLDDSRFDGLDFVFGADNNMNPGFAVRADEHSFFIYYDKEQKTYLYTNVYGNATKIYVADTFDNPLFHLMGGFNGRGYIWSKSLPILKETLILGSGPDTYPFMFPQYDYVSLIQNGWAGIVITKPHNMYLQTAIQTGVLSLIAFLIFYVWYFIASFKLYYRRTLTTFAERTGAAVFISSICFMIAGLANDSSVGVSIVF